ncbi:DUF2147 domain-containing protein [Nitritalea halalkaliphila]|nr:DUF2147 domain-containing protein [Nitritalea halalkaliphila]
MKQIKISVLFLWTCGLHLVLAPGALAQSASDILGVWWTQDKDAKVELFQENGKFYGKLVWIKSDPEVKEPVLDTNNPERSLRSRPLLGIRLLEGFTFNGERYEGGTIYDPTNGKKYSSHMTVKNDKTLELRGYVGVSFVGRSVTWTRAEAAKK